jgi:hypothetical protein
MAWIPVALRNLDLLDRYGPYVYSTAVEFYKIYEKLKKDGKQESAEARKLTFDYELAFYKAVPRKLRKIDGLRNVRDGARKDAEVA